MLRAAMFPEPRLLCLLAGWTPTNGADSAADAKRIYDRWAEIIRNRLAALRDFDASQKETDASSAHSEVD